MESSRRSCSESCSVFDHVRQCSASQSTRTNLAENDSQCRRPSVRSHIRLPRWNSDSVRYKKGSQIHLRKTFRLILRPLPPFQLRSQRRVVRFLFPAEEFNGVRVDRRRDDVAGMESDVDLTLDGQ